MVAAVADFFLEKLRTFKKRIYGNPNPVWDVVIHMHIKWSYMYVVLMAEEGWVKYGKVGGGRVGEILEGGRRRE